MDTSKYAALFLSDSRDHLQQCDGLLLAWEREPAVTEPVTGLFRAMHTIKGMAATMGYGQLAALTHEAEHLLDAVRSGRVVPSRELVALMFEVVDAIGAGVEDAVAGSDGRRLDRSLVSRVGAMSARPDPDAATPTPVAAGAATPPGAGRSVAVTVRAGVVMGWARAMLAIRRAESLGRVSAVSPDPAAVDPEQFGGRVVFRLESRAPADEIRALLLEVGDVEEVLVDDGAPAATATPGRTRREVRVAREQLDRLMAEVGELVVARNRLAGLVELRRDPALDEALHGLSRLTDRVHERVLAARMAPVAEVFDRFPRSVRDLARQVGKDVRLEITGREIELDRAVLDLIQDPVLHLLRNAVDHGLESPAERALLGKPAQGEVRLEAARDRESVVITVADDGRGIDRGRIEARLRAEGSATDIPDESALLAVLGRPGFSTAAAVTAVSGRGVGIDVVLTRIREIGGVVSLRSTPGQGSAFQIRLPVTMAVVPVLLATAGGERYAVPLARVLETGRGLAERLEGDAAAAVAFRGGRLPARDLRRAVGVTGLPPAGIRPFLVVAVGERRGAVLVDTLLGRQDLVIDAVELPAGVPPWITGAAVLPDGMPAFLLDPAGVFQEEGAWPS